MSDKKIPFTTSMQAHWVKQLEYYAPLTQAVIASGARYMVRLQDVKITESSTAGGGVKVEIKIPIDDDKKAETGSIELIDSFVLSGDGRRVKSFDRQIKWNKLGSSALWEKRERDFRSAGSPLAPLQQQFVDQFLTKPLVLARLKASPPAMEFMVDSGAAIQQGLKDEQMQIFPKDPSSFVTVEKLGDGYKVKVAWAVDRDEDGNSGRFIMEDQFLLGGDKKFKSHLRQWRVHLDSSGNGDVVPMAQLYGVSKPSKAKAKAFIEAIAPALFPTPQPGSAPETETRREPVQIGSVTVTEANGGKSSTSIGGTGRSVEVAGPRVQTLPSGGKDKSQRPAYLFSFSQNSRIERNTNEENAGGLLTRAIGPSLRGQLAKRGNVGTVKFNFAITFDKESGHVTKVEVTLLKDAGLGLVDSELKNMLKGAAQRIHMNLRAGAGLAGDTLWIPTTFEIRG